MSKRQVLRTLLHELRSRILQKEVTVYDSYGYRDPADDNMWVVPMRVWVHDNRDTPFVGTSSWHSPWAVTSQHSIKKSGRSRIS